MRLYHYVPAEHGLQNIRNARLKICLLEECNDPFELWGCYQRDPVLRKRIADWKRRMASRYGVLCFSQDHRNALMWSHYADKHRGLCLGFDVTEDSVRKVSYTTQRMKLSSSISEAKISSLLYLKYKGWSYEQEWRSWVSLEEKKGEYYFCDFGTQIALREVFVGSFSTISRTEIEAALAEGQQKAFVVKKRLAFKTFAVVENREYRDRDAWK